MEYIFRFHGPVSGDWVGLFSYNKTTSSLLFSIEIEMLAKNTSACENRYTQGG